MKSIAGETPETHYLHKEACPQCGSKDNVAVYSNGRKKCFGTDCDYVLLANHSQPQPPAVTISGSPLIPLQGGHQGLPHRKIAATTCSKYNYFTDSVGREVATYYNEENHPIAQKVRTREKKFSWRGKPKEILLFGQQLWKPQKRIVVTEGEIDCLSVAQLTNCRWPVISVPNGAPSAARYLTEQLLWLEEFEQVVICFDMDKPGRDAAIECAELLSPGKAHIVHLPTPYKDPSDMLIAGANEQLTTALWAAKPFQPSGVLAGDTLWETVSEPLQEADIRYPFDALNDKLHGIRNSEMVVICAGSGLGKTQVAKEIIYHAANTGAVVGCISLEESVRRCAHSIMGLHLNKPIHLPHVYQTVTQDELHDSFKKTVGSGKYFFLEHFGSLEPESLMPRIRYLVKAFGCDMILLDHISMLASGSEAKDERKMIDLLMTNLRTLVQELNIKMIAISHLKRPDMGAGHENGAKTSLAQLRGSGGIGQLTDIVIGLERASQDDDPEVANTTTVRILKNRFSGELGVSSKLLYSTETGRLTELESYEL